ncbi:MAG: sigma 54-interacting transcriptional regulator [Bdellovibrionaceae bacterium]|nr:sigma 54-interacting transcriptional regulator [Pseudobdellovibrionaceae bacterium]
MLTKKIKDDKLSMSNAFLYWKKKEAMEQTEVKDFLSIGREKHNLLVLDDSFVSRRHARIEKKPDKKLYILKDMDSQNGVFLNGSRIQTAILNHNDNIQIGNQQFTFSYERFNHKWKMVCQSKNSAWNKSLSRIPHIANSSAPVLLLGPSGTGKELIAQMIHNYSKRSRALMVSINCSALTESLVESELFGHTRGSYTGSINNRKGAFLTANKGTLFMDEIGDLPISLQPKLLRAIEYKEIKSIGSDLPVQSDVRIISATHQDLNSKIQNNNFRKDLFFRLNVVTIKIPSLSERMEDFEQLFHYFCLQYGVTASSTALKLFKSYHWPGNIRELKNTIERAKALFPSEFLDKEKALSILERLEDEYQKEKKPLWLLEKKSIIQALKTYKGNQTKVSQFLEIPRSSLHDKIKHYQIDVGFYKKRN